MKITTKVRYGSRAILQIAFNYGIKITKREEIVREQGIPNSYLENILVALRSGGLIITKRGPSGGYNLSRPPSEISLMDIYKSIEGTIALVDCVRSPSSCKRFKYCPTTKVWKKLSINIQETLEAITLRDLLKSASVEKRSDKK